MSGFEGVSSSQARLTFAIARHALVDLSQIFNVRPTSTPVSVWCRKNWSGCSRRFARRDFQM